MVMKTGSNEMGGGEGVLRESQLERIKNTNFSKSQIGKKKSSKSEDREGGASQESISSAELEKPAVAYLGRKIRIILGNELGPKVPRNPPGRRDYNRKIIRGSKKL